MDKLTNVTPFGGKVYRKKDLMKMEPELLRALLRERIHHNIEVPFYALLLKCNEKTKSGFGLQAQMVFDVWLDRGFSRNDPDIQWAEEYIELAKKIRIGEKIIWEKPQPSEPFDDKEMKVINKLLYERRSVRNWIDKPVPDGIIEKILEAGRAAPIGCNLDEIRFIVLRDSKEIEMIWNDIPINNAIVIVICYDRRIPEVVSQDKFVPHNVYYDAAAAADHMLLMAHALGLGGIWLSKTVKSEKTKDTGKEFKNKYGLPEYIEVALHIAIGWPAVWTIKTQRMPLSNMMISKHNNIII